ncbi:bifunctional 4-hydroxy-2-oxoglutarate aldolase/2-dehydro-3-deoxy-phosphogluconate aldolase [Lederbergia lenta]|nr:bifunctional 4-hydroxy-2-oxoglutarate aldolase/2-dehydro-3-deoxy-phosphogluconate aldolase [Lederbergia lenta]MCM3109767.1 bifunctional 4-hydroxy-2-oxoglutarate aldolase/2-dehydro-3-deoxy-phosphogluconate aldolase [Lederbergia lenta]MEC2324483.1 bifunctional 4-hydroxy-2-oxoglutarate aldolase/2-dehydro-3-deoxy-phosphogluconate aldolase [Lederbergia lenta]
MDTLSAIQDQKLIAIIRNLPPADVLKVSKALRDGGVRIIEITMNSPKALTVIEELTSELGDDIIVGAGTVLDPETARAAILAGAKFILSPTVNLETIKCTKRYGALSIPGAFTPTEILTAFEHGADIVKVFPASLGSDYIKDILGPLSQIPLLPTGGVNLGNIQSFIRAGAIGCGIGGSLVNSEEPVTEKYLAGLTDKAEQFISVVRNL